MEPVLVSSSSNPAIKLARALIRRRALRYRERLFFAEGSRVLETLAQSSIGIQTLFLDESRLDTIDRKLLETLESRAKRLIWVVPRVYAEMTDTDHPQALAAICEMPDTIFPAHPRVIVGLDAVRDPGNLGTIARLAAAFDVSALVLLPGSVDPFSPKCVRASAGSVAQIPIIQAETIGEISEHWPGLQILVSSGSGSISVEDAEWQWPCLIVIGNEAHGASESAQESADLTVRIPIAEHVESLNAATAASILIWEATRWRNRVD